MRLRDTSVPFGAISRFDMQRFAGEWRLVSTGGGWAPARFSVAADTWSEQRNGDAVTGRLIPSAPGRMTLRFGPRDAQDLWVLWTDEDHTTIAIGTPDGSFGFVAQRLCVSRADQAAAAAQVLDFNGYQTAAWPVRTSNHAC